MVRGLCARGARRAQPSCTRARTPAATLHPGAIPHGPPRARALTVCAPVIVVIERLFLDERLKTSVYLWEREGYARDGEVRDGARGVRRRAGVMHGRRNAQSSGARALGASVGSYRVSSRSSVVGDDLPKTCFEAAGEGFVVAGEGFIGAATSSWRAR